MLQKIVGIGFIYMVLSAIETYLKLVQPKNDRSRNIFAASLLLVLLDAAVAFWIFSSLVQTTRTLRLRRYRKFLKTDVHFIVNHVYFRNAVKLSLYNHFTNTLIFAVLASLIFMLWSIYFHRMDLCLSVTLTLRFLRRTIRQALFCGSQDWKELWLDEAFWKLLFTLLLMVIMILWRPANNNQRYAFTPLLDSGDEGDDDDVIIHDSFGNYENVWFFFWPL